jgi:hypothetical protein
MAEGGGSAWHHYFSFILGSKLNQLTGIGGGGCKCHICIYLLPSSSSSRRPPLALLYYFAPGWWGLNAHQEDTSAVTINRKHYRLVVCNCQNCRFACIHYSLNSLNFHPSIHATWLSQQSFDSLHHSPRRCTTTTHYESWFMTMMPKCMQMLMYICVQCACCLNDVCICMALEAHRPLALVTR